MAFGKLGARGGFGSLGALGGSSKGIRLSASTIPDTTASGSTVGTLSVVGATGTPTFSLSSNPGALFSNTGALLKTAATLTAGLYPISVHVTGMTPTVPDAPFLITVTSSAAVALKADLSNANTNEAWVFW